MEIREKGTKEEQRIIERTKETLLYEVEEGARDMKLMGMKVTEILEPLHDSRCETCVSEGRFPEKRSRCVSEGRFPERQRTREPSIDRDDSRRPTEDMRRIGERLRKEAAATRSMQAFVDSRLTKVLKDGRDIISFQLWAESGGPVWKQVKVPEDGGTGLLMMPVRKKTRRRSKVLPTAEMEKEEQTGQSKVWPPAAQEQNKPEWTGPEYGPSKSMEVVLTMEVDGNKREVVIVTNVTTGR